jgi:hypothetical protein
MLITVPSLNYAVITIGNFVVAKRCNRQTEDSSAVKVTCRLTLEELQKEGYLELPPPPVLNGYSNLLKC